MNEDYTRAIRFETKEVALGLVTQLSKRNTNYVFHALEVKTTVIAIDE